MRANTRLFVCELAEQKSDKLAPLVLLTVFVPSPPLQLQTHLCRQLGGLGVLVTIPVGGFQKATASELH